MCSIQLGAKLGALAVGSCWRMPSTPCAIRRHGHPPTRRTLRRRPPGGQALEADSCRACGRFEPLGVRCSALKLVTSSGG